MSYEARTLLRQIVEGSYDQNGVPLQYQKSLPMVIASALEEARSDAQNPRPNIMLSWNPVHYNNQMTQLLGAVKKGFEYVVNYVNETQTYFSYQAVRVESFEGLVEYAVVVEALERSDSSVALYSPNVCEEDMSEYLSERDMRQREVHMRREDYMGIQSETSVTVQQQIVPDDMMAKTMKHDEVRVPAKVDLKVERFRCAWMGDLTFDCGHGGECFRYPDDVNVEPHVGQMRFHCVWTGDLSFDCGHGGECFRYPDDVAKFKSIKKKGRLWAGELRFDCGNGGGCFRCPNDVLHRTMACAVEGATMKGIGGKRRYRQPRMGVKGKREARGLTTRKRIEGGDVVLQKSLRLSREMETEILENRKRFTWAEKGKWKPVENTDTSDHHSLDPLMEETNKDSDQFNWAQYVETAFINTDSGPSNLPDEEKRQLWATADVDREIRNDPSLPWATCRLAWEIRRQMVIGIETVEANVRLHEWECVKVIEKLTREVLRCREGKATPLEKLPIHSAVTSVPLQASHKKRRRDDDTYVIMERPAKRRKFTRHAQVVLEA